MANNSEDINELKDLLGSIYEELQNLNYNNTQNVKTSNNYSYRMRNYYRRSAQGRSFKEIHSSKYENQQAKELLEVLKEIEKTGEVTEETKKRLEELGVEAEELGENLENVSEKIDEVEERKRETSLGNRLVGYNNLIRSIGSSLKNMDTAIYGFVKPWADADHAASKYAKTIAATAAGMKSLRDSTINNVVKSRIGIYYNMNPEDLLKAQQSYVQGVGRNLRIDSKGQESLAAMNAVMGGKENDLAVAFENFGVGLERTGDHVGKMFDEAARSGISFERYSDNVAKNIRIAQNYTFKNGLAGLESMAKKATALRMDMSQVAALADKVSSVEGSIDVASKLQVLGGSFASMADPLGMMAEGLLDMDSLMDRVTKMIGGLGNFDKSTGEVKVSAFNKQRIKAAADAMGMSYDQLMESVNAQTKRQVIEGEINKSANARGLSKDMQELLKNSATFDKEGRAGVSINGEFKTLDQLTNDDYDELVKETQSESADIKDIARNLRSLVDTRSGIQKQKEAVQAKMTGWLGEGMKKITARIGRSNVLLGILVALQGAGVAMDILANGMNILDMFRGRGSGKIGRVANGIKRWAGKTRIGRGFRKARVGVRRGLRKVGARISTKAAGAGAKVTGKFGNRIATNTALQSGKNLVYDKVGTAALSATQKIGMKGAEMSASNGIKGAVGRTMFNTAAKAESGMMARAGLQGAAGTAAAASGTLGSKIGQGLAEGASKGLGWGILFGVASAGVEIGRDYLVEKGKIKKGKALDNYMTVTAEQAKWAGIGSIAGGWGMLAGAIIGTFTGIAKGVKRQREVVLDAKLERMGLQRQGDYGARRTKLINRALTTGEMSRKTRRKLEKGGDFEIIEAIERKKAEEDEKKEALKDRKAQRWATVLGGLKGGVNGEIAEAMFTVQNAYFTGKSFGYTNQLGINSGSLNDKLGLLNTSLGSMNKINGSIPGLLLNKLNPLGMIGNALFGAKDKNGLMPGSQISGMLNPISTIKGIAENGSNSDLKTMMANIKQESLNREFEEQKARYDAEKSKANQIPNKLEITINGSIKLTGANGQEADITKELLGNREFIDKLTKQLADPIKNQINANLTASNFPSRRLAT